MATTEWAHTTVMLKEAVEALDVQAEATYVDTTFGRGGHAKRILDSLSPQGTLIAFDKDPQAIQSAQALNDPRLQIHHQGFVSRVSRCVIAEFGCQGSLVGPNTSP